MKAREEKQESLPITVNAICAKNGHRFYPSNYIFARDAQGVAFKGAEFHTAPKYVRYVCGNCTVVREIQVCPRLENRITQKKVAPEEMARMGEGK